MLNTECLTRHSWQLAVYISYMSLTASTIYLFMSLVTVSTMYVFERIKQETVFYCSNKFILSEKELYENFLFSSLKSSRLRFRVFFKGGHLYVSLVTSKIRSINFHVQGKQLVVSTWHKGRQFIQIPQLILPALGNQRVNPRRIS